MNYRNGLAVALWEKFGQGLILYPDSYFDFLAKDKYKFSGETLEGMKALLKVVSRKMNITCYEVWHSKLGLTMLIQEMDVQWN
jgi:hypothetical protein